MKDFVSIASNCDQSKMPPFMKFFWDEQQKYISSSNTSGVRYHPQIIRYCLSLAVKSPAFYDDIRYNENNQTGFLILPSRRRLRDYKNYIQPQQGFNKGVVNELAEKVQHFSPQERYIILLMDEMKVQEDLVWDKHSGELIGYIDLGDPELNCATMKQGSSIASHILVFLVRCIVNPLKFTLANFATCNATSVQLFPVFWKAVAILEDKCKLKVMGVTSMFNNGYYLLWSHISQLFKEDLECGLRLVPKITSEHINLTHFSVMNVKLVLSTSVSVALQTFAPTETLETAKFCEMMDKYFDCLNVRNTTETISKQTPFLNPYTSVHDERFEWLTNTFLQYFYDWRTSIESRPGMFTANDKALNVYFMADLRNIANDHLFVYWFDQISFKSY